MIQKLLSRKTQMKMQEIWADSLDILSVSIESPSGEYVPRIPARMGASMEYTFLYEGSTVTVDYQITENVAGMEVIFVRLKTPVEGTWKFYIYSLTNIKGSYNAWLPLKQFSGQEYIWIMLSFQVKIWRM